VNSASQTITLSMTANKTVTANYETAPTGPTLTVSSSGVSSVPISSLTGFEGTTNYTRTVNEGSLVILTAPSSWAGATFTGWTGAVTSSNTQISLIMDSNKSRLRHTHFPSPHPARTMFSLAAPPVSAAQRIIPRPLIMAHWSF
jgi:hypothetical protein